MPFTFALIPAAGKSTRMGRPKLALPLGKRTILERVIDSFRLANIEKILVVLPPQGRELHDLARAAGAEVLMLSEETPDMRSTVQHGLDWMAQHWQPGESDCWLLAPADHPLLEPAVIGQLLTAWRTNPAATIIIPTFGGQRGHPALIGWNHIPGIRALPPDQGLNRYFRQHTADTQELPVDNPDILCDLDTPEDYERLLEWQVEKLFPAVAQWVQDGHIEIGDQEMFGFVARALDYGGLVFEDDRTDTLAEALAALEKGLTEWFKEQGIEVKGRK